MSVQTQSQESTTIGGYGELHFNKPDAGQGVLDFHRFVLFVAHTFNDNLTFKSELELEHTKLEAGEDRGGEIALEQAYLDWQFSEAIGLRAGLLLTPIGTLNEVHEPSTFNGVERPNVDRVVIPSTWRESGAGIYGRIADGMKYQLYLVAGLTAEGLSGASGIRGARQEGLMSSASNPSVTGQLEYIPIAGLSLSGSFFAGKSTGGVDSLGGGVVTLLAGAAQFSDGPFSIRCLGAFTTITDTKAINAAFGKSAGSEIYGFYVEGAYDVAPLIVRETEFRLDLFARLERYDTQAKVVGFDADPANDRTDVTLGLTFKPTYNTVFKFDYQIFVDATDRSMKQFNLGVGYSF